MGESKKLIVTEDEIGVIVEVTQGDGAAEIASARAFIRGLSTTPKEHPPRSSQVAQKTLKTLAGRIIGLGGPYFSVPRESVEISKELARSAHHYSDVRVRVELSRLVRRGLLRRLGDGTKKNPYRYVNP